jgi:hypothetical protein
MAGKARNLRAIAATKGPQPAARRSGTPTGEWRPGYELDGESGQLVTDAIPDGVDVDWDHIFRHWNLDPELWVVVDGSLRVNAWEGPTREGTSIFRQYKATIRRRPNASRPSVVDPVLDQLARRRPRRADPLPDGPHAFVCAWADWQVGGHGTVEEFVARFEASLDAVAARARRAVRAGASQLVVGFLGDMVEGVDGQYASQLWEITLDGRSQRRMVRAAEAKVLTVLAPLFASTTVVAVPGNHGRPGPKVLTSAHDNADLECFEVVADKLTGSGFAAAHDVSFIENPESVVALVEAAGTQLLWVHGDQVRGDPSKLIDWWRRVAFTRWQDADCGHILLAGHRHHLRVEELAHRRWLMQCPTLGGESKWFAELGGGTSQPGTLSFTTADGAWWGLHID